jgi:hypothetical protein
VPNPDITIRNFFIAVRTSSGDQFPKPSLKGNETATALRPAMTPSMAAPTVPDDSTAERPQLWPMLGPASTRSQSLASCAHRRAVC